MAEQAFPELERRWRTVHGCAVFSREQSTAAPPGSTPTVLVHGLVVSSRYLVPVARRLAPLHPVYVPDLPGFGHSQKPPEVLDVPGLAAALLAWLGAAGLNRVSLLGNSLGCQIAVELAVRHPERVASLVLVGPTVDPCGRNPLRLALALLRTVPFESPRLNLVTMRDFVDAQPRWFIRTLQHMLRHRVEERLPLVRAPVLVVRGSQDAICSRDWAERVVSLLPHGRLVEIRGGGHALNYSHAGDLGSVTAPFLAEVERPAGAA